jgi:hypothetical protein
MFQVNNAVKCVLEMPKREITLLNKEEAVKLAMKQDIIKQYTSSWTIINTEFQNYEDDDAYIYIKTDRISVSNTKCTDSITVENKV